MSEGNVDAQGDEIDKQKALVRMEFACLFNIRTTTRVWIFLMILATVQRFVAFSRCGRLDKHAHGNLTTKCFMG